VTKAESTITAPNLRVDGLSVVYRTRQGQSVFALDEVSLDARPGECVAVVGESGSGKSTFGVALGGLLPRNGTRTGGQVTVGGEEVYGRSPQALRALRRERLAFVFQNPVASLDPTMRIERQLALAIGDGATGDAVDAALERVEFRDSRRVARSFPHELSGGMAQRVGIALALARDPLIVIADEPTASLDATLRRRLLELLIALGTQGLRSLVVLTHDLAAVARYAHLVAVMYGGRIVECGTPEQVFQHPFHPYTRALLEAAPGAERPGDRLRSIAGSPPVLRERAHNCSFAPRCPLASTICRGTRPATRALSGRVVACHRAEELAV
jgi:oligopeptide/dipeptide ABC transporter ATP-binding protein